MLQYFLLLFIIILCEFGVAAGAYEFHDSIPYKLRDSWIALTPEDKDALQIKVKNFIYNLIHLV
jgi:hypothetical protein